MKTNSNNVVKACGVQPFMVSEGIYRIKYRFLCTPYLTVSVFLSIPLDGDLWTILQSVMKQIVKNKNKYTTQTAYIF